MIAVNDLLRINAVGSFANQRIILTHAYAVLTTDGSQTDQQGMDALINNIRGGLGAGDQWESAYLACLPAGYTLEYWQCQKVAPVRVHYTKFSRVVPGTHADTTNATNQAAVITLGTVLAGRSNVSNKHIGPIPQSVNVQSSGLVAAAYQGILSTLAANMLLDITDVPSGITFSPVIPHRLPAGAYTLLSNYSVGTTVRTMRRRTVGVGE